MKNSLQTLLFCTLCVFLFGLKSFAADAPPAPMPADQDQTSDAQAKSPNLTAAEGNPNCKECKPNSAPTHLVQTRKERAADVVARYLGTGTPSKTDHDVK